LAACCDPKTCDDVTCLAGTKKGPSWTLDPNAAANPGQTDCCADKTGYCRDNKNGVGNVACTAGYKDKANIGTLMGTDLAACCDPKTCDDVTCLAGKMKGPSWTLDPNAAADPGQGDCCTDKVGYCTGNFGGTGDIVCNGPGESNKADFATLMGTDKAACCEVQLGTCEHWTARDTPFTCPTGQYARDIAFVPFRAATVMPECELREAYGPQCPEPPPPTTKPTADFAIRLTRISILPYFLFALTLLNFAA